MPRSRGRLSYCPPPAATHLPDVRNVCLRSFSGKEAKLEGVSEECRAGRPPPVTPARFRALLEDKSFTSKRADIEAVGNLYEGAFEQRMGEAETLKYAKLGWTDEDVKVLCEALGAARSLKALYLNRNRIGSEGVRALAGALRDGKAPSLRKVSFHDLHLQNLDDNPAVSEADKQALRDAREGLLVE